MYMKWIVRYLSDTINLRFSFTVLLVGFRCMVLLYFLFEEFHRKSVANLSRRVSYCVRFVILIFPHKECL